MRENTNHTNSTILTTILTHCIWVLFYFNLGYFDCNFTMKYFCKVNWKEINNNYKSHKQHFVKNNANFRKALLKRTTKNTVKEKVRYRRH